MGRMVTTDQLHDSSPPAAHSERSQALPQDQDDLQARVLLSLQAPVMDRPVDPCIDPKALQWQNADPFLCRL